MECFVKSFSRGGVVAQATVLSSDIVLDGLEKATSTVTVSGRGVIHQDAGSWLILDGDVYYIQQTRPRDGDTILTLLSPIDAFSRPLPFEEQPERQTIGGFIADMLRQHWVDGTDPFYATPYLLVSNSDTTPFVSPELDKTGLLSLPDYCRLVRRTYGIKTSVLMFGASLVVQIGPAVADSRQVSFTDGRSQLIGSDFAAAGVAKITSVQGTAVRDWYLSDDGTISEDPPANRAPGTWTTITVDEASDAAAKVAETFAKNKSGHKIEFYSELDLQVGDKIRMVVENKPLSTYVSAKRRRSNDHRILYTAGELATTAAEKLKGASK